MNRADAEEYTESLGFIVAGRCRQIYLAERLGVPKTLGMSLREWVEDRLGGYIRLTLPERREAVAELEAEGMSTRQVADVLGISQSTAARESRNGSSESNDSPPQPRQSVSESNDSPPKQLKCKHCPIHGCP
jgi:DNA invertase Pin-like site-specific DNA recombinase